MNLAEIKKYLHHREPYLMVDKVLEISENSIVAHKNHTGDESHIQGHFPGAPVVPGAMLQELCTQAAGIVITKFHSPVDDYDSESTKGYALGVLNKIEFAKFLQITKPGIVIEARVELIEKNENLFKFKAKVFQEDQLKAKIKFNLVNISDTYLY
jgi:3-hydroxyacyl-[acyl-carrier-protein] dehydratase